MKKIFLTVILSLTASIESFFEPFREMNIEELYATALQIQDFFDRYPHMKRDLY